MSDNKFQIIGEERGFTVVELLVSMLMFAVISAGLAQSMSAVFKGIGREYRLSTAVQEARLALGTVSAELRMASAVSPYLPGNDPDIVTCAANFSMTPDSIKFLLVHDSNAGTNGLAAKYVSYSYDEDTQSLLRGEIDSASNVSCSVPTGDPLDVATPIAQKIIRIDYDDDGTPDEIFRVLGNSLVITYGIEVTGDSGTKLSQKFQTTVLLRNHVV